MREREWDSPSKLPLPPFVAFAQRKMWKICSGNHCLVKILFPRQLLRETTLLWGEQIFDRNYFQRWTNILTNIWQKLLWIISKYLKKKITYSIKQWFVKDKSIFVRWIFSQMFFFMEDGKYFSVLFHFCTLCNIFMAP